MALENLLAMLERRAAATPDTPCNRGEVSAKPASILACTLDTPDTPRNVNAGSTDTLPEPHADPGAWRELAAAYHAHHFNCITCQAAGRGKRYGLRCVVGSAMWRTYQITEAPGRPGDRPDRPDGHGEDT